MPIKISYKYLIISSYILIILSISTLVVQAQIFDQEQNPPGIKWQQIRADNFQILYPSSFESEAQRMANTLEYLVEKVGRTLRTTPRKITIILQNQGVISNGFVQSAPRRSELFTTPPQNSDPQDWLNSLAVHELRHVVQMDKLTGGLKAPLFEELGLAIFGINLPPWFFEGDAVAIETSLSEAGRGRMPDWEMIFRTNTLNDHSYSYSKNYFGSYKDRTAGYYQLGYFMTTKLRRDYGQDIMNNVMSRIAQNPIRPYNLSSSVRKYTGMDTKSLYNSTIAELDSLWKGQEGDLQAENYPALNHRKDPVPVDYLFPVRTEKGAIITLKAGLSETPTLISIDETGREEDILKIGYQTENNFNYAAGKLVWTELRYDPRYRKRTYNVINSYDIDKKTFRQLTHKSRLFSPVLSPDGRIIAAIRVLYDNTFELVELDAESGAEIRNFPNPENYTLQTPSFSPDGQKIVCVAVGKAGASLLEFKRREGTGTLLLPFQRQQISRPVYSSTEIIFRAHYNGINNLYALNADSEIVQLTSAPYGASNPSYDKAAGRILFNNYQSRGYDISSVDPNRHRVPVTQVENSFIDYAAPLASQEAAAALSDTIPNRHYPSERYREMSNLFYFHSMSPIAEITNPNDDLHLGIKLKSDNQLNTLSFYTGYRYNSGLDKSEYLAGLVYKRFFPVIGIHYINRSRLAYSKPPSGNSGPLIPVNWREDVFDLELRVPLVFHRLNKSTSIGWIGNTGYASRYHISNRPSGFIEKIRFPMRYQFYLNHNSQRSLRDIAPRWGQNISLSYRHLPFEKHRAGDLFALKTLFFFPGLSTNHSFQASFNYQGSSGIYTYEIDIPKISGYAHSNPATRIRNTLLLDYRFPLAYPDAELGRLAYIKRIRGGLFADFENIGKNNTPGPASYGLEVNADMNLMRFYLPVFELTGKLIFLNKTPRKNPVGEIGLTYSF